MTLTCRLTRSSDEDEIFQENDKEKVFIDNNDNNVD